MKTHNHPSGITIYFDAGSHRYSDSHGRTYTSVSSVLKSLFKPFDSQRIAARVAERENRPVADVLAEWAAKGAAACRLGTRSHAVAEAVILAKDHAAALTSLPGDCAGGGAEPESPRERAAFAAAWSAASKVRAACVTVHPEVILADPDSQTAGTADLIAQRRVKADGTGYGWTLIDYKTSAEIDFESKYGDRALPPFEYLHDCHHVKYSLQLHLYRWMLLHSGYLLSTAEPVDAYIVHLAPDAPEPAWIPALDLHAEADAIMRGRRERFAAIRRDIAAIPTEDDWIGGTGTDAPDAAPAENAPRQRSVRP